MDFKGRACTKTLLSICVTWVPVVFPGDPAAAPAAVQRRFKNSLFATFLGDLLTLRNTPTTRSLPDSDLWTRWTSASEYSKPMVCSAGEWKCSCSNVYSTPSWEIRKFSHSFPLSYKLTSSAWSSVNWDHCLQPPFFSEKVGYFRVLSSVTVAGFRLIGVWLDPAHSFVVVPKATI